MRGIVTISADFSYNLSMVLDELRNLSSYFPLDDSLRTLTDAAAAELPPFHGFMTDRERSTVFMVEDGSITASTTWRENPISRDVTAAVRATEGMFVLYLPGEPFLVKADTEDTKAVMLVAGRADGS